MSIKKAKIYVEAKLRKRGKILFAETKAKRVILSKEEFELLSLAATGGTLQDLARKTQKDTKYLLKHIIGLEDSGVIDFRLPCEDRVLQSFYRKIGAISKVRCSQAGLTNILAYEREWGIYPLVLDFLDYKSENYGLKNFEKEIYLDVVYPLLNKLPKNSTILDAGGGIGRFAVDLGKKGHKIHLVDSSEVALKKALRHFLDSNLVNFDLHWANVSNLSMFADNTFDATLAIELICYSNRPDELVKELARVTKKNGLIIISVEGKYGSMLSDPNVSFDKLPKILKNDLLYVKNYLYVKYYTPESLERLLEGCGIRVIDIHGSHYLADGIFHKLINMDKLDNIKYRKYLINVERLCRDDSVLKSLARAWIAIARK